VKGGGDEDLVTLAMRGATLALACAALAAPVAAAGQGRKQVASGLELDLLPVVLSAVDGEPGIGGSVWIGTDRMRLRAVGAAISFPPGTFTPSGFENRKLAVAAGIVDYFFRPRFAGPWIGAGFEYWWNRIGSPSGPDTADWSSWVFTVGGGYVWKIWGELYLNPWVGGHLLLSRPAVTLYGATWPPSLFSAEVSLKIGWSFWW